MIEDLIEIIWFDAVSYKGTAFDPSEAKDGRDLLTVNHSYGKLRAVYKHTVVLVHHDLGDDEAEYTVIPRNSIIDPHQLRSYRGLTTAKERTIEDIGDIND